MFFVFYFKVAAVCHVPRFGRYISIHVRNMSPQAVTRGLCEVVAIGYPIVGKHHNFFCTEGKTTSLKQYVVILNDLHSKAPFQISNKQCHADSEDVKVGGRGI